MLRVAKATSKTTEKYANATLNTVAKVKKSIFWNDSKNVLRIA